MYLMHTINEKTITVFINGLPKTISAGNANFTKVKACLISGDHESVPALMDVRKGIEEIGLGEVKIVGNSVLYLGQTVPDYQAQKLVSMYRDGCKNIEPLKKFIVRLMQNPSMRAREEFARFADYKELPFDEEGFVYGYKGVQPDYYSLTGNTETRVIKGKVNSSGQIYNAPGEEIEVERPDVDDDCNHYCSKGLHVGSFDYATGFGPKHILIKIDPKDVVSVPLDCNGQKVRVCHYWVVRDLTETAPIKKAIISDPKKPEIKKEATKIVDKNEYYETFAEIVSEYILLPSEVKVIKFYMNSYGLNDEAEIDSLIAKLKIAERIAKYVNNKGGTATLKQIQSALKSYALKQAEIEEIMDKFGPLIA